MRSLRLAVTRISGRVNCQLFGAESKLCISSLLLVAWTSTSNVREVHCNSKRNFNLFTHFVTTVSIWIHPAKFPDREKQVPARSCRVVIQPLDDGHSFSLARGCQISYIQSFASHNGNHFLRTVMLCHRPLPVAMRSASDTTRSTGFVLLVSKGKIWLFRASPHACMIPEPFKLPPRTEALREYLRSLSLLAVVALRIFSSSSDISIECSYQDSVTRCSSTGGHLPTSIMPHDVSFTASDSYMGAIKES